MSLLIYGASDDLIEVEGDIREEFQAGSQEGWIAISDGSLFLVNFDRTGVWRLTATRGGRNTFTLTHAPARDEDNYSDRLEMEGEVDWVVFGDQALLAQRPHDRRGTDA